MPATDFTITDAGEIALAPHLYREKRADEARLADHAREAARTGGVRFGGMEADPIRIRSEAEQRAAAQAAYERMKALGESARGRFLLAIRSLEQVGYEAVAETARAAYSRGFADERRPACPRNVAAALKALAEINHSDARAAISALAEILAAAPHQKAA